MSKIICDICGTTYQDTAPCCPICGCTRDAADSLLGDELLGEEIMDEPRGRGGHFTASKKKKEILKHNFNIEMTKTMEREVSLMCNLSKGIEEKGIAIGFKRGLEQGMERGMEQGMEQGTIDALLSSLRNLMENTGWSLEQSMSVLNVPENLRSELIDQLKQPK